jgi:hypothetical protein
LTLAYDLGERLLPAFYTKTGIPYSRVGPTWRITFTKQIVKSLNLCYHGCLCRWTLNMVCHMRKRPRHVRLVPALLY